eukprot:4158000-Amphidinium_carterae.1
MLDSNSLERMRGVLKDASLVGSSAGLASDLIQPHSSCTLAINNNMEMLRTTLLRAREQDLPFASTDWTTKLSTSTARRSGRRVQSFKADLTATAS